jgi:hypothetical protein
MTSLVDSEPSAEKRRTLRGIFWMLDNGAKWKDLPRRFGTKSTVHRWFQKWTTDGVFERLLQHAGRCVEERDGFKLYECFIDGTFSKAKSGGDGIGATKVGKGVKFCCWSMPAVSRWSTEGNRRTTILEASG